MRWLAILLVSWVVQVQADQSAYLWTLRTPVIVRGEVIQKVPSNQISYTTGERFNNFTVMASHVLRSHNNEVTVSFQVNEQYPELLRKGRELKVGDYGLFFITKDLKRPNQWVLEFHFSDEDLENDLNKARAIYAAIWEGNIEQRLKMYPEMIYDQNATMPPKRFQAKYAVELPAHDKNKTAQFSWLKKSTSDYLNNAIEQSVSAELMTFDFPYSSISIESTVYRKEKIVLPSLNIEG